MVSSNAKFNFVYFVTMMKKSCLFLRNFFIFQNFFLYLVPL